MTNALPLVLPSTKQKETCSVAFQVLPDASRLCSDQWQLAWKIYTVCFENIFACCLSESKLDHVLQYLYYPDEREKYPYLNDIFRSDNGPPGKMSRPNEGDKPAASSFFTGVPQVPGTRVGEPPLDDCQIFMKNIGLVLHWGDVVAAIEEHVRRISRNDSFHVSEFLRLYDNDDVKDRIRDLLVQNC